MTSKFLDQVREYMRTKGYAYKSEKTYVHWIKRFGRKPEGENMVVEQFLEVHPDAKLHKLVHGRASIGRNEVYITCPFCGVETLAYLWSLAGGGKRCQCGAKHTYYGYTIPPNIASTGQKRGASKRTTLSRVARFRR